MFAVIDILFYESIFTKVVLNRYNSLLINLLNNIEKSLCISLRSL